MVSRHELSVNHWYRVKKSQQLVSRFLKRCSKELWTDEDEKTCPWTDKNIKPLETVFYYTEEQDIMTHFEGDVEILSSDHFAILEVDDIGQKEEFLLGDTFAGFFLRDGSFRIVQSAVSTTTTVNITIYNKSQSMQDECKVLEMVVFDQLKEKCNFLERLRSRLPTSSEQSDDKSMERRHIVEGLIGDAIALFNLSTIEKISHPNIPDFKSKTLSNKVAKELFKVDSSIKGAGYRYSTLQIDIVEEQDETKREQRERAIKSYLSKAEIEKFEFCYVSPEETLFTDKYAAGAECRTNGNTATLGCFAYKESNEDGNTLCALVSRHFAIESTDSNVYLVGNVKLGTVLKSSITEEGYDIAAVIVDQELKWERKFRNMDGHLVQGYLHETNNTDEDYALLQDMEVYMWGLSKSKDMWGLSKSKDMQPGFGKIIIPNYIMPDCDLHHVVVEDRCPEPNMAIEGDSGGILCRDCMDHEGVFLILMLTGSLEDPDLLARNPGINETYHSFLLKNGLDQLSQQTQCQFQLP